MRLGPGGRDACRHWYRGHDHDRGPRPIRYRCGNRRLRGLAGLRRRRTSHSRAVRTSPTGSRPGPTYLWTAGILLLTAGDQVTAPTETFLEQQRSSPASRRYRIGNPDAAGESATAPSGRRLREHDHPELYPRLPRRPSPRRPPLNPQPRALRFRGPLRAPRLRPPRSPRPPRFSPYPPAGRSSQSKWA